MKLSKRVSLPKAGLDLSRRWRPCRSGLLAIVLAQAIGPWVASIQAAVRTVYGVSTTRHTTVVVAPRPVAAPVVVAPRPVVVAPRPVAVVPLPAGYIAVLPVGYRSVYVGGVRYYAVGGIHYRPQFYQGRTVYVRHH